MLRRLKNWWGRINGFGGCPNCGDTFMDSNPENLPAIIYKRSEHVSMGMIICCKCYAHPETIDILRVCNNLSLGGWEADKVKLVAEALQQFKGQ